MSNLLLEAYYLGKLDLFLVSKEENRNRKKTQNRTKRPAKGQTGTRAGVAEKPRDSSDQRSIVPEPVPSEKSNGSNKKPGWLIDLEEKINSFVQLKG